MHFLSRESPQGPRAAAARRITEPMVFVGALLVIPSLILNVTATSDAWRATGLALNIVSWSLFALEIAVMMIVVQDRRVWLADHWLDVAVTVLTIPWLIAVLEGLRLLRLARLLSALRLLRLVRAGEVVHRIASPAGLLWSAFFALASILVGAATFHWAESGGANEIGFGDAFWWAITTATTVGYGDLYPTTTAGRIIAVGLMMVGIGLVAMLTAAIAGWAAESSRQRTEAIEVQQGTDLHTEVAGLREEVKALQDAIADLGEDIRRGH